MGNKDSKPRFDTEIIQPNDRTSIWLMKQLKRKKNHEYLLYGNNEPQFSVNFDKMWFKPSSNKYAELSIGSLQGFESYVMIKDNQSTDKILFLNGFMINGGYFSLTLNFNYSLVGEDISKCTGTAIFRMNMLKTDTEIKLAINPITF